MCSQLSMMMSTGLSAIEATIDSYTAAASDDGICSRELIPLPMMSRSIRPVSLLTSAHVRRETTADLILVRSPSSSSGNFK